MNSSLARTALDDLRAAAVRLTGAPSDFDALLRRVEGCRFVLIGEASHGTHEFYRIRAELTKRLIREQGFSAVAIEGDWPHAYRVNRFVRGDPSIGDAEEALADFARFPQWMWRNADVLDFVGWLRAFNDARPARRVGFYGLDLYSLHASIEAVVAYLRTVDPAAALRALRRYDCFTRYGSDPQHYGYATLVDSEASCESEVVRQLVELRAKASEYAALDDRIAAEQLFHAEQNARVVVQAERYYRVMYHGGAASWNLRDTHMAETLEQLVAHLDRHRPGIEPSRVVVWAHNSHLGDASATEASARGETNLGHLVRKAHGRDALLVGFTTYEGSVTAASDWGAPAQRMRVRPALPESYEALFHAMGIDRFALDLREHAAVRAALGSPRLERFIGVIYRPETERMSHYYHARLSDQFDVVFHHDRTRAVEPLERTPTWQLDADELPETYPSAL
ncbi:MAG: erythromycin esterase family protein [Gemmatimonadaceae bacterium]